jgi:hypothetical protein
MDHCQRPDHPPPPLLAACLTDVAPPGRRTLDLARPGPRSRQGPTTHQPSSTWLSNRRHSQVRTSTWAANDVLVPLRPHELRPQAARPSTPPPQHLPCLLPAPGDLLTSDDLTQPPLGAWLLRIQPAHAPLYLATTQDPAVHVPGCLLPLVVHTLPSSPLLRARRSTPDVVNPQVKHPRPSLLSAHAQHPDNAAATRQLRAVHLC